MEGWRLVVGNWLLIDAIVSNSWQSHQQSERKWEVVEGERVESEQFPGVRSQCSVENKYVFLNHCITCASCPNEQPVHSLTAQSH